jgi:2-dehydro-3-deoxyphosphogluconate aldolase / (4S)-4-hydroxy-2-oxoglutarate aldolase
MHPVLHQLSLGGIVPVVVIEDESHAEPLAGALLAGGLSTMEITFRTKAAHGAMARITQKVPGMLLGAGTVLSVDQVKMALDAGAKYIVSPGFNRKVVEYCISSGVPVTPGTSSPTDVEAALELGLEVVKFFPAEAAGGLAFLKAISAPYKQVKFIPTGGIDENNILSYLKFGPVLACGGSWMVKADLVNAGKFAEVTKLTQQAVRTMLGLTVSRVGVSAPTGAADALLKALGGSGGIQPAGEGTAKHVAIGTHFPERAIAYFHRHGVGVRQELKDPKSGKVTGALLDVTLDGFDVRIEQR